MKMNQKVTGRFAAIAICALTMSAMAPAAPAYARTRTRVSDSHKSADEKMRDAAEQVQKAFEKQDMDKLADVCSYPLVVSYTG